MKLVFATALLVAAAFAAPRGFHETDAIVPEELVRQPLLRFLQLIYVEP